MVLSIRALLEFLGAHGYDQPISLKILSQPTNKVYQDIVYFMIKLIDPNFVPMGKTDEDIISIFKFLGYPFTINKSNIAAVGSPHAWPHMLASINWLSEMVTYNDMVGSDAANEADGDNMDKGFYRYLHKAYSYFLCNKDEELMALEEQYAHNFHAKNLLIEDASDGIEQKNLAIENEITAIKQRSLYLPELNGRKTDLMRTVHGLHEHVTNRMREVEEISSKVNNKKADLEAINAHIHSVKREVAKVRDILGKQEISADDVVNMNQERIRLESTYQQLSEMRVNLNKEIYRLEIILRDAISYLENSVRSYHGIAEDLKLVPITNKNARGEDYSIEVDIKAKRREQLLRTDIKNRTLPLLGDVRKELQEMTLELRQEVMLEQERIEELENNRVLLNETASDQAVKLDFLENIYAMEKANFDQINSSNTKELYTLEHKLLSIRDITVEEARITSLNRKISELNSLRSHYSMEFANKKALMVEEIINIISLCASHREEVQNGLDQLKTAYGEKLQSLLSKESMVNLMFHFNTIVAPTGAAMLSIPNAFPEDFESHAFGSRSMIAAQHAENDSVRYDDDVMDDGDMSMMGEADHGSLHALMHGFDA